MRGPRRKLHGKIEENDASTPRGFRGCSGVGKETRDGEGQHVSVGIVGGTPRMSSLRTAACGGGGSSQRRPAGGSRRAIVVGAGRASTAREAAPSTTIHGEKEGGSSGSIGGREKLARGIVLQVRGGRERVESGGSPAGIVDPTLIDINPPLWSFLSQGEGRQGGEAEGARNS